MPMNKQPVTIAEDQIAESLTEAQQSLDTMFDAATSTVDLPKLKDYCSQFTIAVLLEELRRRDQQRADELILWINEALESGDTAGELVWQWNDQIKHGHQMTSMCAGTDQPAFPAEATTCHVQGTENHWMDVLGVATATPGLLATQAVRRRLSGKAPTIVTGQWMVVHERSGLRIVPHDWPLDTTLSVAADLGTIGVDWTLDADSLREVPEEQKRQLGLAIYKPRECRWHTDADHAAPAWRTTPSAEAGAA